MKLSPSDPLRRAELIQTSCLFADFSRRRLRRLAIPCAIAFALVQDARAASPPTPEAELMSELMEVLDETTEIATKTKLNADYVPGMVTVLDSHDLQALGMRTVWEALSMIPGVQISKDDFGSGSVAVRGFGSPFNSGNIKAMIDGVSMSREGSGLQSPALDLPLEQVERIEFIRGPGAALYGDFAYAGVLNVITRRDASGAFARTNGDGTTDLGARYVSQTRTGEGDPVFTLNLAGRKANDAEDGKGGDASEDLGSAIVSLASMGWKVHGQAINRDFEADSGPKTHERSQALEVRRAFDLGGGSGIDAFASYLSNDAEIGRDDYVGQTVRGGLEAKWRLGERHQLLAEGSYTHSGIDRAFKAKPLSDTSGRQEVDQRDVTRDHFGFSLQDQYELRDDLTITGGARFDHRNDLELDLLTPRLAVVWRPAEGHILKAQYAEGYRAPTFWELYANNYLAIVEPERVSTSEVSWIHRTPDRVTRVTLFNSRMDDHISPLGAPSYAFGNTGTSLGAGVELEWEQHWSPHLKSWANLSYADTEDGRKKSVRESSNEGDPTTADVTANLALLYQPMSGMLIGVRWNYVGERHSQSVDAGAEHRVSAVLTLEDFQVKGLDLRLGVSNLLGEDQTYLTGYPLLVGVNEFPDREVWGQISYEFR